LAKKRQLRKCERCRIEYPPIREAQNCCGSECRRQAAYGRERFRAGTKGRRKRRLEASDKPPCTLVAGSFRNGHFSSIKSGCCRPTNWIEKLNQAVANEVDRAYWTGERRRWPVDVMGGARQVAQRPAGTIEPKLRQTIIETERLLKDDERTSHPFLGDDIRLEYYEDGYPKFPACSDRCSLPELARAA
jgi:hypothetical protein